MTTETPAATGDTTAHVRHYRERRYKGLDQRIVHDLEARIINGYLARVCREGDSVLDMPIGYGRFIDDLHQRGCNVVGGDRKQGMLDLCTETWGEEQPLVRLNGDALPFADDSFDGLTCIRLFQHLHDPALRQGVMNEIGRVTRRWAIVTTYLASPVHGLLHRSRGLKRLSRHDGAGLQWMLGRAGLRLVEGRRSMPGLHAQYVMLLEPADPVG
ncbi:MAG: class I SAM-dependent methyltransferase [Thiohalospira sp.]